MEDDLLHDYALIEDQYFPVSIALHNKSGPGPIFESHRHEHFQFIYCIEGEARIYCHGSPVRLAAGEVMVINTHEMHYGENVSGEISYYVIMVDLSFLLSRGIDSCQAKYISPLAQSLLLFENRISDDVEVRGCIKKMIEEYNSGQPGYELAIKACVYNAIVLLLRKHVARSFSRKEYDLQAANMKRFHEVFNYIEENLNQEIDLKELAAMASLSVGQFCRVFKKLTGRSTRDYINQLRIEKAVVLLKEGEDNMGEVAYAVGFGDSNYFSRVFKKYKGLAPTEYRKSRQ